MREIKQDSLIGRTLISCINSGNSNFPPGFMLILSLVLLLLSTSITSRQDKSILYSRATITILLIAILITQDNLFLLFLNKGIGIFGGLFHSTSTTTVFHIVILAISSVILLLTSFYPRKV